MPNLYETLIGAAPTDPEQVRATADALRRKSDFGILGMLSGDNVLGGVGQHLHGGAQRQTQQLQQTRQSDRAHDLGERKLGLQAARMLQEGRERPPDNYVIPGVGVRMSQDYGRTYTDEQGQRVPIPHDAFRVASDVSYNVSQDFDTRDWARDQRGGGRSALPGATGQAGGVPAPQQPGQGVQGAPVQQPPAPQQPPQQPPAPQPPRPSDLPDPDTGLPSMGPGEEQLGGVTPEQEAWSEWEAQQPAAVPDPVHTMGEGPNLRAAQFAREGGGVWGRMKEMFDNTAGAVGLDQLVGMDGFFPSTMDARKQLEQILHATQLALANNPRFATTEMQRIDEMIGRADRTFQNPRTTARRMYNLYQELGNREQHFLRQLEEGVADSTLRRDMRRALGDIQMVRGLMEGTRASPGQVVIDNVTGERYRVGEDGKELIPVQ
jgi:hypothetical protein